MKNVYLFNPDNDLALACGEIHYTPPKRPRKMADDLASLPRWYAEEGEKAEWITSDQLREGDFFSACRLVPWGWNESLIHKARLAGFKEETLHTDAQMRCLRARSNRASSVRILKELRDEMPDLLCGDSVVCHSQEEVECFHEIHRRTLLKAPWSCNGRGLLSITYETMTPQTAGWIAGLIKSQGSVVAEKLQEKVCDFAMEFFSDGTGKVTFAGYSLFQTDSGGRYVGNILSTDERIVGFLSQWIPVSLLESVRDSLEKKVGRLLQHTHYRGFLGIDMLVARFETGAPFRLLPCVEINLRMNMGMVARCLSEHFIRGREGYEGLFRVDYYANPEELYRNHEENQKKHPLQTEQGKVLEGYYSLTPVLPTTHYRAAVWIRRSGALGEGKSPLSVVWQPPE